MTHFDGLVTFSRLPRNIRFLSPRKAYDTFLAHAPRCHCSMGDFEQLLVARMDDNGNDALARGPRSESARQPALNLDCALIHKKLDDVLRAVQSNSDRRPSLQPRSPGVRVGPLRSPLRRARCRSDGRTDLRDLQMLASAQASWHSRRGAVRKRFRGAC